MEVDLQLTFVLILVADAIHWTKRFARAILEADVVRWDPASMDHRVFRFATRGHCIEGKQC